MNAIRWTLLAVSLLGIFNFFNIATGAPEAVSVVYSLHSFAFYNASSKPIPALALSTSSSILVVENATVNSTVGAGNPIQVTEYRTTYVVAASGSRAVKGEAQVTITPTWVKVISPPQLVAVEVHQQGRSEVAWSGDLNSTATVYGLVYLNGTSNVTVSLFYLNGSSLTVYNATSNSTLNVDLIPVTVSVKSSESLRLQVQDQFPRRYSPLVQEDEESNLSSESNYNLTIAYFNGTYVPALVWKGEGYGGVMLSLGIGGLDFRAEVSGHFTTIEFFGINGTALGYVHVSYVTVHKESLPSTLVYHRSEIKEVLGKGATLGNPEWEVTVYVGGRRVLLLTSGGNVESTAEVEMSHQVFIHSKGILLSLKVNSSEAFMVVFIKGGQANSSNVSLVTPSSVRVVNFKAGDRSYEAQEVQVNESGYILFNVTILSNASLSVYKETPQGNVTLNSTNYFVLGNRLYVFDDPSTNYYVVYGGPQTSSTTSPSTQSSPTSTSATSGASVYYISAAVIAVVVVVILVLVTKRHK